MNAKITRFPQKIGQKYCQYIHEHVDATIHGSKNGSVNDVCLQAQNCKRMILCEAIRLPKDRVKTLYVKCCGICERAVYCKYRKKTYSKKEPVFIPMKERSVKWK